ncbi:hypothetical protein [Mycobacteroides chelonae]|nr:hypothetical protein [Mycobacteroides chelonae]QQG87936.1 hypothetical protein HBA99_12490 [Mycobacteroides chelonae]QQG92753.1 hypothetical protein HBA97_12490 [Mycobacteroides chelonae]
MATVRMIQAGRTALLLGRTALVVRDLVALGLQDQLGPGPAMSQRLPVLQGIRQHSTVAAPKAVTPARSLLAAPMRLDIRRR